MKSAKRSNTGHGLAALLLVAGNVALSLVLAPTAFAQTQPAVELEGAIAKEQVDGDLKTAISEYQKIAANTTAPRDIRAKALMHLASCYEKLGQQAQKVYEQIVRDFGDQPVAAKARARLAVYSRHQALPVKELKPIRLTTNTSELPVQTARISPDGKFVAYSDPLGVHVRSTVTRDTRLLPGTQGHLLLQWMSDGQSIRTQVLDAAGKTIAMVVPLRDGPPQRLTSDPFITSPDGSRRATLSADRLRLSIQDASGKNSRDVWRAVGQHTVDQIQWRPDSKEIAVLSSSKSDADQNPPILELIEVATGKTSAPVGAAKKLSVGSMVWVSQDRMIVSADEDLGINHYGSNLWELRFKSGAALASLELRKLTTWADFPIRSGSLSTDGKRLVLIRSFRHRDVYVASVESGGTRMGTPRRLTLDLGDDYPTAWTADSRTVIFTSARNGPQGIFRQDLDKQTAEQIVVMPGNQLLARVTPDAGSLLFLNYDPAKSPHSQLMRVPVDGGESELVPSTERIGANYRCSPAGPCVMAQKQQGDETFVISELDPIKGKGREIYRDSRVNHLFPSPDGKLIADTSGDGSDLKIILRSFSTGAVVREIPILGVTKLRGFDYASDGAGFFLGDASPTEVRELYMDLSGKISVLWRQPQLSDCGCGVWGVPSPNGKYLALVISTDDSNVYMVESF